MPRLICLVVSQVLSARVVSVTLIGGFSSGQYNLEWRHSSSVLWTWPSSLYDASKLRVLCLLSQLTRVVSFMIPSLLLQFTAIHTQMTLSPSSIIWYQLRGSNVLTPTAGKVTVGLASHWPCLTDLSGLSIYRFKAWVREMSTPSGKCSWTKEVIQKRIS